jgi:hypothetical protein
MMIYPVKKAHIERNTTPVRRQKGKNAFGSSMQIFLFFFLTVNDC